MVERDPTRGVGLGVLLDESLELGDRRLNQQLRPREIDVLPSQRTHLTATSPRGRRQNKKTSERTVSFVGDLDESPNFFNGRRNDVRFLLAGDCGELGHVPRQPPPLHGLLEGSPNDDVNLAHC